MAKSFRLKSSPFAQVQLSLARPAFRYLFNAAERQAAPGVLPNGYQISGRCCVARWQWDSTRAAVGSRSMRPVCGSSVSILQEGLDVAARFPAQSVREMFALRSGKGSCLRLTAPVDSATWWPRVRQVGTLANPRIPKSPALAHSQRQSETVDCR
jgi:hypothetical protein